MPRKGRRKNKKKDDVSSGQHGTEKKAEERVVDQRPSDVDDATNDAKEKKKKVELTEKEVERRRRQKEIQNIIVRLMKRGATKDEIRRAKIQYRHGGAKCATGKQRKRPRDRSGMYGDERESGASWREEMFGHNRKKEEEERKGFDHDMVIVPVFWKKEVEQRQRILDAAESIKKDIIALVRFDIWIDQRTKYTPGQKFAFWEHRGVKYRIELGPKEVDNNLCTVCLCEKAGAVAQRFSVKMDAEVIVKKLRELGAPLGSHSSSSSSNRSAANSGGFSLIRRSGGKKRT